MIRAFRAVVVTLALLSSSQASARVFNFKDETLASYLHGMYGLSNVGKTAFENSIPSNYAADSSVSANYSGEIGFLLGADRVNVRLGAEIFVPKRLSDVKGTDASGAELFRLRSTLNALIPTAGLEFALKKDKVSKVHLGGTLGYAYTTIENTYDFNAAGTTATGLTDFTEKGKVNVWSWTGYLAYEHYFTDHMTIAINGGYRSFVAQNFKHENAVTTFQGAVDKGQTVKNRDGNARKIDLGGYFVGIGFRFYLNM